MAHAAPPEATTTFDYALVGGGLQNGLLVLAIRHAQPGASIVLVEQGATLGGNHTWCFHDSDVPAEAGAWLEPLVAHHWPGYSVRFPNLERDLTIPYRAIDSARFDQVVRKAMAGGPGELLLNTRAASVTAREVVLEGGRRLSARLVVDARGARPEAFQGRSGWQKFVGVEIETVAPHGLVQPLLMDARLPQVDGFRFMYVLPFGPTRLLVEDTRFSDDAGMDVPAVRAEALKYASAQGWRVHEVVREEAGVLPMPWAFAGEEDRGVLLGGMRGGWFHPGTGYSLAVASRLAQHVASTTPEAALGPALEQFTARHASQARFAHRMNWALFHLADPEARTHMLSRFYRRPESVIRRFYALDLDLYDRWRIVAGAPPKGMRWRPRAPGATEASR